MAITSNSTDIMQHQTVTEIIDQYQQAQKEIAGGLKLLHQAQKRIERYDSAFYIINSRYESNPERMIPRTIDNSKRSIWKYLIEKVDARSFMTAKRFSTFEKMLDKPEELPEITHDSIRAFAEMMVSNAPDMLLEFVTETFQWLRPGYWSADAYKTNRKSKYELAEKVIKSCAVSLSWGGGFDVRYGTGNQWDAVGNAFSLLDGKGIQKHPNNLTTILRTAFQDKGCNKIETEYFQLKFFRNQNCHIKFKRMDLVAKMNKIAGEHTLKHDE